MDTVRIVRATTRGRVCIPADLRRKCGIEPGTLVEVTRVPEGVLLQVADQEALRGELGAKKGARWRKKVSAGDTRRGSRSSEHTEVARTRR